MGGLNRTGTNSVHDLALLAAEQARQFATAGAPTQAQVTTAELAFHRAIIASCKSNNGGNGLEASLRVLQGLGTGGV